MRRKNLNSLCEASGVSLVYLYGSRAAEGAAFIKGSDETDPGGDILADLDVGVVMQAPLPPASERHRLYSSLSNGMQDCFRSFRVDLVFLQERHSVFQYEALQGICIYQSSDEQRSEYEMMVLRRAADFRPVLNMYLREILEEVTP